MASWRIQSLFVICSTPFKIGKDVSADSPMKGKKPCNSIFWQQSFQEILQEFITKLRSKPRRCLCQPPTPERWTKKRRAEKRSEQKVEVMLVAWKLISKNQRCEQKVDVMLMVPKEISKDHFLLYDPHGQLKSSYRFFIASPFLETWLGVTGMTSLRAVVSIQRSSSGTFPWLFLGYLEGPKQNVPSLPCGLGAITRLLKLVPAAFFFFNLGDRPFAFLPFVVFMAVFIWHLTYYVLNMDLFCKLPRGHVSTYGV